MSSITPVMPEDELVCPGSPRLKYYHSLCRPRSTKDKLDWSLKMKDPDSAATPRHQIKPHPHTLKPILSYLQRRATAAAQ